MIEKVQIENFQSHKFTVLEFDKGVNIIVGKSDSGKSAIIRNLNWIVNNRPTGNSFIRHGVGVDECSTLLSFYDKIPNISRVKNKKENTYYIDGDPLKAVGTDVPEEVQTLLNMSEINFQKQLDAPFLISNTAGDVGRFLNRIVNIDQIDTTLKKIESMRRETLRNIDQASDRIDDLTKKISVYDYVPELEKKVEDVVPLIKSVEYLTDSYNKISDLHEKIQAAEKAIKKLSHIEKDNKKIKHLLTQAEELETKKIAYETIVFKLKQIKDVQHLIQQKKNEKKKAEDMYKKLMPRQCPLCNQEIPE
jgi:DNA repair ATPase RecN